VNVKLYSVVIRTPSRFGAADLNGPTGILDPDLAARNPRCFLRHAPRRVVEYRRYLSYVIVVHGPTQRPPRFLRFPVDIKRPVGRRTRAGTRARTYTTGSSTRPCRRTSRSIVRSFAPRNVPNGFSYPFYIIDGL